MAVVSFSGFSTARRIGTGFKLTLLLGALSLLWAPPAAANTGVPIVALIWPGSWLLLLVIIPLEALVARRLLGTSYDEAFTLSTRANLASTALGIPFAAAAWVTGLQDVHLAGIARQLGIPSGEPYLPWLAVAVAAMISVPSFLLSVGCEYLVARRSPEAYPRGRIHLWAWGANALSYALIFALLTGYFRAVGPGWSRKAWEAICFTNMKVMGRAIRLYREHHHDRIPPAADFPALTRILKPELAQFRIQQLLRCPATRKAYLFNIALSGVSGASISDPSHTPMVQDAVPHADGWRCVLFADGHAKALSAAD